MVCLRVDRRRLIKMGDIREFWFALGIYAISAAAIFAVVSVDPLCTLPRAVRVVVVFGGGGLLMTVVIVAWERLAKACNKLKD